jgi:hypothetical protein
MLSAAKEAEIPITYNKQIVQIEEGKDKVAVSFSMGQLTPLIFSWAAMEFIPLYANCT